MDNAAANILINLLTRFIDFERRTVLCGKDGKQQSYHVKPCNSAREYDAGIVKHLSREKQTKNPKDKSSMV